MLQMHKYEMIPWFYYANLVGTLFNIAIAAPSKIDYEREISQFIVSSSNSLALSQPFKRNLSNIGDAHCLRISHLRY